MPATSKKIIVTQNTLRFHLTGVKSAGSSGWSVAKTADVFRKRLKSEALPGSCASNGTGVDCRCGFGKSD